MASFVPALSGHVELQLERHGVAAGAGVEVEAGASCPFQSLDLAGEDAVHQAAGAIRRRRTGRVEPPACSVAGFGPAQQPGVAEGVLQLDALEPTVAGEL